MLCCADVNLNSIVDFLYRMIFAVRDVLSKDETLLRTFTTNVMVSIVLNLVVKLLQHNLLLYSLLLKLYQITLTLDPTPARALL